MYAGLLSRSRRSLLFLAALSLYAANPAAAQDTIRVYGSEGPAPAMNEAAAVFGDRHGVLVEVVSGPTDRWLAKAQADADAIFSSAEFMMADFVNMPELQINAASVRSLYLRPSAILVRPGNPKGIRDFPHLMRPGIRVMVVTGSGQTGLWEDMAGKQGDMGTVRALRKNVVFFAPNSETAVKAWRERDDIDAWLTWNIWYTPLHDEADLVPVGTDYRVYRQCSIALTERAKAKPVARQFVDFLTSPDGARIFESWGWSTTTGNPGSLTVNSNIAIVCRLDQDQCNDGVGAGLLSIRKLIQHYESIGIPADELHISAVVHGNAGYWLLNDERYNAVANNAKGNPNKEIVHELASLGVSIELCAETMDQNGWGKADVLPEVTIVVGACPRIVDLQLQGYAYWRF